MSAPDRDDIGQGEHGTSPGRGASASCESRTGQQPDVTEGQRSGDSGQRRDDERNPSAPNRGEAEVEHEDG